MTARIVFWSVWRGIASIGIRLARRLIALDGVLRQHGAEVNIRKIGGGPPSAEHKGGVARIDESATACSMDRGEARRLARAVGYSP
jgi:hypothetical protein